MHGYAFDQLGDINHTHFSIWSDKQLVYNGGRLIGRDKLSKIVEDGHLVDGERYALCMNIYGGADDNRYYAHFQLVKRLYYDENECTIVFCQHINSRAFTNRRAQFLNESSLQKLRETLEAHDPNDIRLRSMYCWPRCTTFYNRLNELRLNGDLMHWFDEDLHHLRDRRLRYPRTRG